MMNYLKSQKYTGTLNSGELVMPNTAGDGRQRCAPGVPPSGICVGIYSVSLCEISTAGSYFKTTRTDANGTDIYQGSLGYDLDVSGLTKIGKIVSSPGISDPTGKYIFFLRVASGGAPVASIGGITPTRLVSNEGVGFTGGAGDSTTAQSCIGLLDTGTELRWFSEEWQNGNTQRSAIRRHSFNKTTGAYLGSITSSYSLGGFTSGGSPFGITCYDAINNGTDIRLVGQGSNDSRYIDYNIIGDSFGAGNICNGSSGSPQSSCGLPFVGTSIFGTGYTNWMGYANIRAEAVNYGNANSYAKFITLKAI